MYINIVYRKFVNQYTSYVYDEEGKVPRGFSDGGIVLEGNDCLSGKDKIEIYGCTMNALKGEIQNYRLASYSDNQIRMQFRDVELFDPVIENIHLLVGNYILEYEMTDCNWSRIKHASNSNFRNVTYTLNKIYKHNDGDTLTLVLLFLDKVASTGLDKDTIDKIISESTEIEIE